MSKTSRKGRFAIMMTPVVLAITFAQATPDETPCGIVVRSGKGNQLIPPKGKVQLHFADQAPVACGSMLITHDEAFWVKMADMTFIKVAPNSFLELPHSKLEKFKVYRGELLVSAPPSVASQTWSTPNSEVIFKGGVAWIQYDSKDRRTTVASFNREFEFRNKFNESAKQTVAVGETSNLAIHEAQVMPSHPEVMSSVSVATALEGLALPDSDLNDLTSIVKRVYEARSKSLVSDIEDWKDSTKEENATGRSVASVPEKTKSAVNEVEANFVKKMLRERLYGSDEDQKQIAGDRVPGSVPSSKKIADPEYDRAKKNFKSEAKRVETEIDHLGESEE